MDDHPRDAGVEACCGRSLLLSHRLYKIQVRRNEQYSRCEGFISNTKSTRKGDYTQRGYNLGRHAFQRKLGVCACAEGGPHDVWLQLGVAAVRHRFSHDTWQLCTLSVLRQSKLISQDGPRFTSRGLQSTLAMDMLARGKPSCGDAVHMVCRAGGATQH